MQIKKLISGGQTGVDRAALDLALELKLPCGGWCPKGRRAEDGALASKYPLYETPSFNYTQRTQWNVRDSEGTLVLTWGDPSGGTARTIELASRYKRPCLVLDLLLKEEGDVRKVRGWLKDNNIRILNVAGPRESSPPRVYDRAVRFLRKVFEEGTKPSAARRGST